MELVVFCCGTSYNTAVLSKVGHVCEAEDLSLSPGALGDRGESSSAAADTPEACVPLNCGKTRFLHVAGRSECSSF